MKKLFFVLTLLILSGVAVNAQRVTDKIDRGIVAIPSGGGNFVSWRLFGEEYYDTKFNLYRDGVQIAADLEVSNFRDGTGTAASSYQVEPVVRGVVQDKSAAVKAWAQPYLDVPVLPVVNRAGNTIRNSVAGNSGGNDTTTPGYTLNDVTLADVTGDGICEFIVKRNNNQGNLRQAANKTDFNLYECYKIDGTRLWWIDLGPNLMAGADEQWDLIAYDWDEDGKAEGLMRGADNMIIHTATGKTINIGDMTVGFGNNNRPEYMGVGKEYLLYLNGETGEPYGWDGSENWTPMDYPLPQFEPGESGSGVWGDLGHRMQKHYFGAPYLDGRHASIFLGRGCYTRHKFCALDVDPQSHKLTQRWRWNCYDSASPWFGNGFHNFQIADVDMDGRDEIMFGSMCIDDTGFGLSTTGLGHGDAQHCGDLDPYRWGLEQFTCQEGSEGNSYWNPTTGQVYYRKSDGGDDGRCLAGNFSNNYPGGQGRSVSSGVIGLSSDKIISTNGDVMSGSYANLNNRIYWDGDLLDEIFNSKNGANREAHIMKWGGSVIASLGAITNNWTKCNPSAQGDILGDWREELVLRLADNSALRILTTAYTTNYPLYTLWHDHQYRNGIAWQCVGYNQPPHPSFFLGELEGITIAPPPLILRGRTEVANGATIASTDEHLLISGYEDQTVSVQEGASPYIVTVNAPAWVQGSGAQQAVASTPKAPARTIINYTTTLTGGAFSGATRVVKQGEGTLVLPAVTQTYTGSTDVWQGTLRFDGTMQNSRVWLNRHTVLDSRGGSFMGGLQADYNATIFPGGKDQVGTMKVSKLDLGFGSRVVFDVDAAGAIDQLNIGQLAIDTRDWSFGPKYKTPVFEFTEAVGQLEAGVYVLGTLDSFEGDLDNILIEGISDKRFYLQQQDGKLLLVLEDMRLSDMVFWNGSASNNIWDLAATTNFLTQTGDSVYAAAGDDIIFNDEAATGQVVVKGAVRPNSITFDNDKLAYTLTGDSILGGGTITKNGKAKVSINNENRTGATTINAGTLEVNALANLTGITYGALGDASKRITINDGATLSVSQPIITDQPVTVSGDVTLNVPTNLTFTLNRGLKGTGSTVNKTGAGTLTLGTANTFSTLVVKGGRVNSISTNNIDQLPSTVEFRNGTVWGANYEDSPGVTNNANFFVPKNYTGTFYGSYNGRYTGSLMGEGTFNVYTGGVRCYFDGDWSQFAGTVKAFKENRQNKKSYDPIWAFRNINGMPEAILEVQENVRASNEGYDIPIGRASGKGSLTGSGRWILCSDANYTFTTEVGITSARQDPYGGTIGVSTSKLVKRGEGKMRLTSLGNINGEFTVEDGIVSFNDRNLGTYVNGTNTTYVRDKGRMVGQGALYILNVEEGGELLPCGSNTNETTPGTIQARMQLNVQKGGVVNFLIGGSSQSALKSLGRITMDGTVRLTLLSNYTPKLGDAFTLWTCTSTFSGTPSYDLPALPDGLYWDVSGLLDKTGVVRITDDASAGIGHIANSSTVTCTAYTLSGTAVAIVSATKQSVVSQLRRQGLPAGTYVLRLTDGRRTETEKFVVR